MAFASTIRRFLSGSASPTLQPQLFSSRLYSTLTSPKLFVCVTGSSLWCKQAGLSRLTTDEKLKEAFSPFGQLVEAKVAVDRVSRRSKGFGFVTYTTIEEAEKARDGMNAKFLDGWVIFVDPAKPREQRPPPAPEPSETGFKINKTIGWCG
ncbi:organelle RRM domain-containing protein 2, mitochondrial-like isoform X1 [Hevea brasiliensis]|uniref:organelle RRM domain-containing protein 2, mitochondrial-like isoform X1 n=1 Tax=Hevea brasiliensis TaxID=3981 RepID=UPI0025D41A25|nr:organelle RRM domain-containing protein 2, mitochondrial-like isoform X1 [Hevea brasiliensis]